MQLFHMMLLMLIALGIDGMTDLVSAQPSQTTIPGPSVPGTSNPNNAVGPQGISPPVSGNFGVTQSPGTMMTPGHVPGARPPGVGSGAGPGLSSGAPFSGTGYGTNSLGTRPPDAGAAVTGTPSIIGTDIGTEKGAIGPGGGRTNDSSGYSGPGAGSPGPSMGTTPSSGAMAPGAGGAGGAGGR
jgi:translation initiation factor IF-2